MNEPQLDNTVPAETTTQQPSSEREPIAPVADASAPGAPPVRKRRRRQGGRNGVDEAEAASAADVPATAPELQAADGHDSAHEDEAPEDGASVPATRSARRSPSPSRSRQVVSEVSGTREPLPQASSPAAMPRTHEQPVVGTRTGSPVASATRDDTTRDEELPAARRTREDRPEHRRSRESGGFSGGGSGERLLEREPPTAASLRDDGQPADIDPARLDIEGLKILNRLHRHGHEAYFVGGCVRDLLVGRRPKDFDIATSAEPGEVRSLFRNCRLIGRRFRLAHVFFRGGKLIEVATFRANPLEMEVGEELPEDLLITRDNVFGTAEQDARRRDFTLNGLFYDIRIGRVIDFVDGLRDLHGRTIRTIGDPEVRLREDPVRILRAVRFAAKLEFDFDPGTYAAMESAVEDIPRCAPARLLEEVFRLLRSGASRRCFELLDALGALRYLVPPVASYLESSGAAGRKDLFARLAALDARTLQGPVDDAIIVSVLLAPLAERGEDGPQGLAGIEALLNEMVQTARLPRRISERVRHLLWSLPLLSGDRRGKRTSSASFRRHPAFGDALTVFEIGVEATGEGAEALARWKSGAPSAGAAPAPAESASAEPRKRRRRRGGKGRGTGPDTSEPGDS